MKCNKCNSNIPSDSEFCPICGNKIEEIEKEKKTISISLNKTIIGIVGILIIIGIIATVVYYINEQDVIKENNISSKQDEIDDYIETSKYNIEEKDVSNGKTIYEAYKNVLDSIYEEVYKYSTKDIYGEYFIKDLDNDNVQELVVWAEKEDGNYATYFYTFKNHSAIKTGEINPNVLLCNTKNKDYLVGIYRYPKEKIEDPYEIDINSIDIVEISQIFYNNSSIETKKIETKEMTSTELDNYIKEHKYEIMLGDSFLGDLSGLEILK